MGKSEHIKKRENNGSIADKAAAWLEARRAADNAIKARDAADAAVASAEHHARGLEEALITAALDGPDDRRQTAIRLKNGEIVIVRPANARYYSNVIEA